MASVHSRGSVSTDATLAIGPAVPTILPLENGDRLTRAEFHRRYLAQPNVKKAELIEGVVYMPSPVNYREHAEPTRAMSTWLGIYGGFTPGVLGGDDSTVRLDDDNEPQPDHCLFLPPWSGGQANIDSEGYLEGGPELIVEVAASTASYDLHDKLNSYRRNRVKEYIVWRTRQQAMDWFAWREGQYVRYEPDADGLFRSEIFPGLWLDPAAMLRGDFAGWHAALQRGLASPEHAAFVARLREQSPERS